MLEKFLETSDFENFIQLYILYTRIKTNILFIQF